ncbi:MAG: F0F1 ATP synthase subunit A [Deltaproteobacteria bacterium]|nr:F0F1 ATP synthase subunit A [Deltaproteobacteria bacterium]
MASETFVFLDHTPLFTALARVEGIDPAPIIHGALVSIIIIALAVLVNRSLKDRRIMPHEKTLSLTNLLELAISGILTFMEGMMGKEAKRFLPLIGTTAFFILFSNLLGNIPGFEAPTANYNTTLACAIVIVVTTHIVGIKTHGAKYIKHFLGPAWWLAWLILPIEIIGHLARVLSLSVRLFGNMFGDHLVLATFMSLVALLVPVIFMGLGLFVAFIQTFVFTLLSIIYITGALEEAH